MLETNILFESLVKKNQLKTLKMTLPEDFTPGDLTWLGKFTSLGFNDNENKQNLKLRFLPTFNYIRLYHACCPNSVNSYYQNGFMPLDPGEQHRLFKEITSHHASEDDIARAIQVGKDFIMKRSKDGKIDTRKNICFYLDKIYGEKYYGEFMLGGEYIAGLVNRLEEIDRVTKQNILLQGKIPTVFIVDMPIEMIIDEDFFWILGHIACRWVWAALKNENYEDYNGLHGSINFDYVDPKYISGHYHLEKIDGSRSGAEIMKNLEEYCDKCKVNKKYSIV